MTELGGNSPSRIQPTSRSALIRAFTLIDVLVSMAVIALLIGIMMPSLALVKETARRVACASNVRQIGLGLAMYGDDYKEHLPPTAFLRTPRTQWDLMVMLRIGQITQLQTSAPTGNWDGLGILFNHDYLNAAKIFFCPSHKGEHDFSRYAEQFGRGTGQQRDSIICNYQYRGVGPNNQALLWRIVPSHSALVTDSLRTLEEFNHRKGANVLRADLSLFWFSDADGTFSSGLASAESGSSPSAETASAVDRAWGLLDMQGIDPHDPDGP